MDQVTLLEEILQHHGRLIALETPDTRRAMNLFLALDRDRGRTVYHWSPREGLQRVSMEHIPIPLTQRVDDALGYVRTCRHFGIFVLETGFLDLHDPDIVESLKQIADASGKPAHIVVLLGNEIDIPARLRSHLDRVSLSG